MQTIIGSGGAVAVPLARELKAYTSSIRLVSRNPKKVNETDELFAADMTDPAQIDRAIAGSEVVYVTIGFAYSLKVWQKTWPPFLEAVIASCKKHGAKLVFFDNVYMYARTAIPHMTEESAMQPPSKKGAIRKQLHERIMAEMERGALTAMIARAADFYGPIGKNNALNIMGFDNLMKGKSAQAMGNPDKVHTYTYTPDACRAVAQLGNTPDAFNQVWHVPTTSRRLTTREWIGIIARQLGQPGQPKIQVLPNWMLSVLGIFMPAMGELPEMVYHLEEDYFFDSSKFEKRFGWKATEPEEGVRQTIEALRA